MATTVLLIEAGPTPWDKEDRLVGSSSLPLTAEAMDAIRHLLEGVKEPIAAVYRPGANEACVQTAQLMSKRFGVRARDNSGLDEVSLGLWQGLLPEELRTRFPTVFAKWEESPLGVTPPDGEPLTEAIERIGTAAKRIVRRNRGYAMGLALRPMAMRIVAGTLRRQAPGEIAKHLRDRQAMETIEVSDAG
jgi:broad specificity phosphatase PhoE